MRYAIRSRNEESVECTHLVKCDLRMKKTGLYAFIFVVQICMPACHGIYIYIIQKTYETEDPTLHSSKRE